MTKKLMLKAAQQELCESLGYDKGRVYYMLLTKNWQEIDKEFSYSKKYRVLKSLFNIGALGKFKPKDKDFFSYILLPPSFLYFENVDLEVIELLERIYLEKYYSIFGKDFSQIILRNNNSLIIFLLKYIMEENARVVIEDFELEKILGERAGRVKIIRNSGERMLTGDIDQKISFEFTQIPSSGEKAKEYMGYLKRN